MIYMLCCGAQYPTVRDSIGHVCSNSEAVERHFEEFEVMFAMLVAGGTNVHDARNEARAWARAVAPYAGMKTADCSDDEQCCYNALKDACDDPFCHCHTYDATGIVAPF